MADTQDPRNQLFADVLLGRQQIKSTTATGFIEALSAQVDPVNCLRCLTTENGLRSLQQSLSYDGSARFINTHGVLLIKYLQEEALQYLCGGETLRLAVDAIVEQKFFWESYVAALMDDELKHSAIQCFAWLLRGLLRRPNASAHREMAKYSQILAKLRYWGDTDLETRALVEEIIPGFTKKELSGLSSLDPHQSSTPTPAPEAKSALALALEQASDTAAAAAAAAATQTPPPPPLPLPRARSDAESRSRILGFQDSLVFVNHSNPESEDPAGRNDFEVRMVLQLLRYLGQQGYGSRDLLVATPSASQLEHIKQSIEKENDPILSYLDSDELVRVGLLSEAGAQLRKRPISVSLLDDVAEHSGKLVIISFSGGAPSLSAIKHLISRPEKRIVLIGNAEQLQQTLTKSGKGTEFLDSLALGKHIYDGFPVMCERHPTRLALLRTPQAFRDHTPDGGCKLMCSAVLACGTHKCPRHCHREPDHSRMECKALVAQQCSRDHKKVVRECDQGLGQAQCRECEEEARAEQEELKRELMRQQKFDEYVQTQSQLKKELAALKAQREQEKESEKWQKELDELRQRVAKENAGEDSLSESTGSEESTSSQDTPTETSDDESTPEQKVEETEAEAEAEAETETEGKTDGMPPPPPPLDDSSTPDPAPPPPDPAEEKAAEEKSADENAQDGEASEEKEKTDDDDEGAKDDEPSEKNAESEPEDHTKGFIEFGPNEWRLFHTVVPEFEDQIDDFVFFGPENIELWEDEITDDEEVERLAKEKAEAEKAEEKAAEQRQKALDEFDPEAPIPTFAYVPDGEASADSRAGKDFAQKSSKALEDWRLLKEKDGAENTAIDALMGMVGLEKVKEQVLALRAKIETGKRQKIDMQKERFGTIFQGNPGTGKTTFSRLYAQILIAAGAVSGPETREITGCMLAEGGVSKAEELVNAIVGGRGGVLFVDEAYQLVADHSSYRGMRALDHLLTEIENQMGKLVVIFAGYSKEMEKLLNHNPGLKSRIPHTFQFEDYTDAELLNIFQLSIYNRYRGRMKVEGGLAGLYMRIAIRRLSRKRGTKGFGNARAVQNFLAKVAERQALRLTRERMTGKRPDDLLFTKEDLIGKDPSESFMESKAWTELQELVGLDEVKKAVRHSMSLIQTNYRREVEEKQPLDFSLNRVFLGGPGTGKTLVASLYGRILADCGLLSNGDVVTKNPSDFLGEYIGHSEANTRRILDSTIGKVLIIDEAYMLYSRADHRNDSFRTGVIDTLVAEVQSQPGDDRCIIMLGYEDQMRDMFKKINPGLARRFALEDAFVFPDYSVPELEKILELKMKQQELDTTPEALKVAIDVLRKTSRRPNFGNGGEVENLLGKAKLSFQARESKKPVDERAMDIVFESQDFDPEFDRAESAVMNCKKLFEDVVGCEDVVERLEGYQRIALAAKKFGLDPYEEVPTTFIFKGPPGTGKTTTARKMGQIFYDLGFLSSPEVIECSASDMVSKYIGDTALKTFQLLEKALGKVLFIDEAYRLANTEGSSGSHAKEATEELVDLLTKPRFANKMIVILAGYDKDMDKLLGSNSGLSSRFPEEINFPNLEPRYCVKLLNRELVKKKIVTTGVFDEENPDKETHPGVLRILKELSELPNWGNGRDVKTLARDLVGAVFKAEETLAAEKPTLTVGIAMKAMEKMLEERTGRSNPMSMSAKMLYL